MEYRSKIGLVGKRSLREPAVNRVAMALALTDDARHVVTHLILFARFLVRHNADEDVVFVREVIFRQKTVKSPLNWDLLEGKSPNFGPHFRENSGSE